MDSIIHKILVIGTITCCAISHIMFFNRKSLIDNICHDGLHTFTFGRHLYAFTCMHLHLEDYLGLWGLSFALSYVAIRGLKKFKKKNIWTWRCQYWCSCSTSQEQHAFYILLCLVMVWYMMILPTPYWITSLLISGSAYGCPSATEATLNNIGRYIT